MYTFRASVKNWFAVLSIEHIWALGALSLVVLVFESSSRGIFAGRTLLDPPRQLGGRPHPSPSTSQAPWWATPLPSQGYYNHY